MFRSSSFIFSSTTFSGIRSRAKPEKGISWEVLHMWVLQHSAQGRSVGHCLFLQALLGLAYKLEWGRVISHSYSHWLLMKQCAASSLREWTSKSTRWKSRLLAVGRLSGLRVKHDRMNS